MQLVDSVGVSSLCITYARNCTAKRLRVATTALLTALPRSSICETTAQQCSESTAPHFTHNTHHSIQLTLHLSHSTLALHTHTSAHCHLPLLPLVVPLYSADSICPITAAPSVSHCSSAPLPSAAMWSMSRSSSLLLLLCLLAAVVLLSASVSAGASPSSIWQQPLSSSSSSANVTRSTGGNWNNGPGLSSSSSAPVPVQSTGLSSPPPSGSSPPAGMANTNMTAGSGGSSGVSVVNGRNGWNASSCSVWFSTAVAPRCGLSNLTSIPPFCSLSCASTYSDWFSNCINNAGPLFPSSTGQYQQLLASHNGSTFAAMTALAANCSQCNSNALQGFYSTCQVNQSQPSPLPVNSTYTDLLYTMQFPAQCPVQCAGNYTDHLLPFYATCINTYPPAAIPSVVSAFLQLCAPRTAPSAVSSVSVLPLSASQVSISWAPAMVVLPPSDGVLYFVVRGSYQNTTTPIAFDDKGSGSNGTNGGSSVTFVQQYSFPAGNATQTLDSTVSGGSVYVYAVVACNSVGCSPLSAFVTVVTPVLPPLAPTNLTVIVASPTSASVMWQPSQPVLGDNSILYYVLSRQLLYSTLPLAGLYRGTNTSFSFNDLQPNTTYTLSVVAASYLAGQSLNATTTVFTTPFAAPSPVLGLISSSVNLTNIRLQWNPPMKVGAWAVVYYTVWLANPAAQSLLPLGNTSAGLFDTSSSPALTGSFNVLTAYTFFVTATNTGGLTSAFTASVTVTTPANAPTVLNPIRPTVSGLGGVVTLAWNQSADINNGGSPLTALHVSLMSALDNREIDVPASAQMFNVSALNATAQYTVTWRAMNAYGWSANGPAAQFLTLSAAPTILSFVAGDSCQCRTSFGVNSTLSIRFQSSVQAANIDTQAAVDALFTFTPPIPGSYVGQWTNNGSTAVITVTSVNSTAPSYTIGLVTVAVTAALTDVSGRSASALGVMSPPLSGSWYQALRSVRFFGVNQTSIVVQEDSSRNPISVIPAPSGAVIPSTAVLTVAVMYGTLSLARRDALSAYNVSLSAGSLNLKNITLTLPYSTLAAVLAAQQITYTPMPLSTATDVLMASVVDVLAANGNPPDSVNIAVLINPVNHPPSIRFNGSVLPAWVFGSTYVLPAIVVSDVDNATNPAASLTVVLSAQSVTALLTVSVTVSAPSTVSSSVLAGSSAPSLTLSGPLADLNTYLSNLPISLTDTGMPPSASQASVQLFVNDNGNGGGSPLTNSMNAAVAITCNGTAAPAVTSAVFADDAGSILLTFSTPLDQSATTRTDCSVFFDSNTVPALGSNPSCTFRGKGQLVVLLGFGAQLLPGQSLTFNAAPAVRRCSGGAMVTGSVVVQQPANTVTPVVSISGPSIVSSCDALTLYGQATGLGGRPATATYSWSVAVGSTNDPTQAIANSDVLGSTGTTAVLQVSDTALFDSDSYYFFYLTVTNFLGASNTSSIVVYKSQLALPILQPQGSSQLTVSANTPFFIAVTPVLSSCLYGDNLVMNFSWSISPPVGNMSAFTNPQINVPAFTLGAGSTYTFTLTGVMAVDATLASSAVVTVSVPASPITVSITGGSVQQSSQLVPLSLTATAVDPDATTAHGNWSFTWSCLSSAGVACLDNQLGSALATNANSSGVSSSSLTIAAGKLAADVYTWTVVATNGMRTASAAVSVSVVANPIPIVSITSYLTIVNPNGLLYYAATVYDVTNTPLTYSWSQVSGPALSLAAVAVSLRTATLVLNNQAATVFTSGATYSFQCVVTNGFNQSSFAQVSVTINAPPHGGSLSVSPSSGFAFNTSFALSADGWQSSTGSALSYQFFALAADNSLSQLNVRSGASVFNTQLAQGLPANVTVLVAITDALGATSTYSAMVAVQPPPGLAGDTTGSVFTSILNTAATSASHTSNVGQLFGTLNALQDSIYLALLDADTDSSSSRRLLGFTATSVPSYVTTLNTASQTLVASKGAQTDVTTLANTAIKQTSQTRATTAQSVLTSGQSILSTLVGAAHALPTSTDQARATAQAASTSIIQLAGQQLAVIQLAVADSNISTQSAHAVTTALLSNISAQCDSLSTTTLNVAGQVLYVDAGSALSVYAGCDSIADSAVYAFTSLDNSSVTFPAMSLAGAQPLDGSAALLNSSSQLVDTRLFYMPDDVNVWAVDAITAISPVVYAARVSTDAVPLAPVNTSTVTMVVSVPVATASCPSLTCSAVCAVWDDSQSMWDSTPELVSTSSVYAAASGQSFVDCSVYSVTAVSAVVMAVNNTEAASSSTGASSTSSVALSSSSKWAVPLSSSSISAAAAPSSMPTSTVGMMYPAGSLELGFYLTVSAGVNFTSPAFIANLTAEIADNLAGFFDLSSAAMLQYVEVVSISAAAGSTTRRLLQADSTANVDFVILGTVSALGGGVNASSAASQFQAAAAAGNPHCTVRSHHTTADCQCGRR